MNQKTKTEAVIQQASDDIESTKAKIKTAKKDRKAQRAEAKEKLSEKDLNELVEKLRQISIRENLDFKAQKLDCKKRVEITTRQV